MSINYSRFGIERDIGEIYGKIIENITIQLHLLEKNVDITFLTDRQVMLEKKLAGLKKQLKEVA
tara:strand:- start:691 stop:882 length:192 start_codon:yes stop_codon:yes gene_type:complete